MNGKNIVRAAVAGLAVTALAFSLGGGAQAASTATAPAGSVNTAAIQNGAVTYPKVGVNSVASSRIQDGGVAWADLAKDSVSGYKVKDATIAERDLSKSVNAKLDRRDVTGLESDGPYPGSTKLQDHPGQGANSTEKVPADGKSHAVWVQCADGKVALGGGFRLGADQGDAVASKIQVTASEPTQIKDGEVTYTPIDGDAAGSFVANGWLVEVINSGTVDATVRPWVTCAAIAK